MPSENWHVTLRFLGGVRVDEALAALSGGDFPAATAVLGPSTELLGHHLVVPVAGVDALAAAVTDATRHLGDTTDRPHDFNTVAFLGEGFSIVDVNVQPSLKPTWILSPWLSGDLGPKSDLNLAQLPTL